MAPIRKNKVDDGWQKAKRRNKNLKTPPNSTIKLAMQKVQVIPEKNKIDSLIFRFFPIILKFKRTF